MEYRAPELYLSYSQLHYQILLIHSHWIIRLPCEQFVHNTYYWYCSKDLSMDHRFQQFVKFYQNERLHPKSTTFHLSVWMLYIKYVVDSCYYPLSTIRWLDGIAQYCLEHYPLHCIHRLLILFHCLVKMLYDNFVHDAFN